ncbi:MAG: methyltransferase domain-containing protein, partial [Bacteroidetes bacterium]|nr:methyltransferase domain-containing protein [Bacteroidota bacterium]
PRIRYMINNVVIIEGEAESIPLENGFIDLIVSNNGINNVKDSDTVLSECSRVIKPCGQFIFTMNLENSMFEFYNLFESVLSEMNLRQEKVRMQHHISYSRPPLDNILSQLQKHGFEIIDLEHDQFDYKFADGTAMFRHYFIRWHS